MKIEKLVLYLVIVFIPCFFGLCIGLGGSLLLKTPIFVGTFYSTLGGGSVMLLFYRIYNQLQKKEYDIWKHEVVKNSKK